MSSAPALALSYSTQSALAGSSTDRLAAAKLASGSAEHARAAAVDFEAVYINTMLQQMFANVGSGPFGGGPAADVWRSLLTDEYAKSFASAGGLGLANHVYSALLAQQEVP